MTENSVCVTTFVVLCTVGVSAQYTATIISDPAGTPVSGSTNTFDYPILSSVTLRCVVNPPTDVDFYTWFTRGCFTNSFHDTPTCFPIGQTGQSVTGNNLLAEDAGAIHCRTFFGSFTFVSRPFTLRISGIHSVIYTHICKYCTAMTEALSIRQWLLNQKSVQ